MASVTADLDPPQIWTPGPKSARANMDPPFADLDPPTKLSY